MLRMVQHSRSGLDPNRWGRPDSDGGEGHEALLARRDTPEFAPYLPFATPVGIGLVGHIADHPRDPGGLRRTSQGDRRANTHPP